MRNRELLPSSPPAWVYTVPLAVILTGLLTWLLGRFWLWGALGCSAVSAIVVGYVETCWVAPLLRRLRERRVP